MDIKTAMESTKKNIKGYKIQRNTEVLEMLPFKELNSMYYTHAPQLGTVANTVDPKVAIILGAVAIGTGTIYSALLKKHYLTNDIQTLKKVKSMLENKGNPFENYETDDITEILREKHLVK